MNRRRRLTVLEAATVQMDERIAQIHRPIIAADGHEVDRVVRVVGKGCLRSADFDTPHAFENALADFRKDDRAGRQGGAA